MVLLRGRNCHVLFCSQSARNWEFIMADRLSAGIDLRDEFVALMDEANLTKPAVAAMLGIATGTVHKYRLRIGVKSHLPVRQSTLDLLRFKIMEANAGQSSNGKRKKPERAKRSRPEQSPRSRNS